MYDLHFYYTQRTIFATRTESTIYQLKPIIVFMDKIKQFRPSTDPEQTPQYAQHSHRGNRCSHRQSMEVRPKLRSLARKRF